MQSIGEILTATPLNQQAPSPASSQPTDNEILIRSDYAVTNGYTFLQPPPEPGTCEFCGAPLYYYGGVIFGTKTIFMWTNEPERCHCPAAAAAWAEHDAKKIIEEQAAKRKQEADQARERMARIIKNSQIGGRFRNRTFGKFELNAQNRRAYTTAKRYADNFADMLPTTPTPGSVEAVTPPKIERNGLFIAGSYGTGKTHLAAAIANQLIAQGTPVICMTMIDLLARIKQTFDRDESIHEREVIATYRDIPLLIIDDLGSEQPTEWGITNIFAIVNARYEAYMPTIVTTNYSADELVQRLTPKQGDAKNAEKTVDRLKEMCYGIDMTWDSWRTR